MRKYLGFSEKKLVKLLKKGDVKAFDELYYKYITRLGVFVRVYFKDEVVCEEILHETFIKVWELRESLDENLSFKAFLFTIVKNKALNILRKKVRLFSLDQADESSNYISPLVEEQIDFTAFRDKTFKIIDNLPEIQQKVFRMSRFDGKKNEEISQELNISRRTVEHHIYLALKTIRERLEVAGMNLLLSLMLIDLSYEFYNQIIV